MNLLVSLVGPTAVGKTSFAIELAEYFETEIISVDSRQFYKELEIGTAKPSQEELDRVKHHFINSHSVTEVVNAGMFEKVALNTLENLFKKNSIAIAVGGSGLYFQALWNGMDEIPPIDPSVRHKLTEELATHGLEPLLKELAHSDPEYFESMDQQNPQRVMRALEVIRGTRRKYSSLRNKKNAVERPFINLKIGLTMEREKLYKRINERMEQMIQAGLFEEANRFQEYKQHNALQTVGYVEVFDYLDGIYDKEEAIRLLKRNSRRYAKRQYTWFNRDTEIVWMNPAETDKAKKLIEEKLRV